MNRLALRAALCLICIFAAGPAQAQSSFAGVLLADNGSGIVAGNVQLTVSGGQVSFRSTLFQAWGTNTHLEPTLEVQGDKIVFGLGEGTNGVWPVGEFTGPLPGQSLAPAANQRFPNLEQMPGPQTLFPGTRFAGSFTAFAELEDAILTSGGRISLRVNGTVNDIKNPLAVEVLVTTSPRISNQFAVILAGTNEIPPHASLYRGNGSFTLDGDFLTYDLALEAGFRASRASVFGPAGPQSDTPTLIAGLRNIIAADSPGPSGMVIYRGQVNLTDLAVEELRRGELYINIFSAQHPRAELRGPILPIHVPAPNAPGNQPVISVAPK